MQTERHTESGWFRKGEHRANLVEESLDNSIEMVLRLLGVYISGKRELV